MFPCTGAAADMPTCMLIKWLELRHVRGQTHCFCYFFWGGTPAPSKTEREELLLACHQLQQRQKKKVTSWAAGIYQLWFGRPCQGRQALPEWCGVVALQGVVPPGPLGLRDQWGPSVIKEFLHDGVTQHTAVRKRIIVVLIEQGRRANWPADLIGGELHFRPTGSETKVIKNNQIKNNLRHAHTHIYTHIYFSSIAF